MRDLPTSYFWLNARAELIEVSAELPAILPADLVASSCDHRQRWPKNWRRERKPVSFVSCWFGELFWEKSCQIPSFFGLQIPSEYRGDFRRSRPPAIDVRKLLVGRAGSVRTKDQSTQQSEFKVASRLLKRFKSSRPRPLDRARPCLSWRNRGEFPAEA